jgi:hypothetical protein
MERCPLALWKALKERYEQQKELIWPSTNHEWNHLRLQDFKTIAEYNHDVHTICSKLKFCEKEPTNVEKMEKTLSNMLSEDWILHQQYCSNNFQQYSQLTHTLSQVDKHHELLLKNAHQHPSGFAPFPEVHYNAHSPAGNKKNSKENNSSKSWDGKRKFNNRRKFFRRGKGDKGSGKASSPRDNSRNACSKCGYYNHTTKECRCPKHLVLLYQNSLKNPKSNNPRYEDHFNSTKATKVVQGSTLALLEPQNTLGQENTNTTGGMLTLSHEETVDDMLIEYFSKDPLGDLA